MNASVYRHFQPFGIGRSKVHNIIENTETRGTAEHATKGKIPRRNIIMTDRLKRDLIRAAQHKIGISQRILARRFGISQSFVNRALKQEGNKYKKRMKAPQATESQKNTKKRTGTAGLSRRGFRRAGQAAARRPSRRERFAAAPIEADASPLARPACLLHTFYFSFYCQVILLNVHFGFSVVREKERKKSRAFGAHFFQNQPGTGILRLVKC